MIFDSQKLPGLLKKTARVLSFAITLSVPTLATAEESSQVSQYGITWTFDKSYQVGKFVTGDWWIVGPAVIKSVTPAPEGARNGSMVNPVAGPSGPWRHAYDNRGKNFGNAFDQKLSVAYPFEIKPGQSLVSTASVENIGDRTPETIDHYCRGPLRTAAVLTCVDRPPEADAFRPAYVGDNKKIWRLGQLRRELLPKLALPEGAIDAQLQGIENGRRLLEIAKKDQKDEKISLNDLPVIPSTVIQERLMERLWLDYVGSAPSGALHPIENMPSYGREIANTVSTVSLMLLIDDPKGENELLLRRFIQLGIDYWGVANSNSETWMADGGISSGRKWPVIFAGLMLGDMEMAGTLNNSAEDQQTYYGQGYRGQKVLWRIRPTAPAHEESPPDQWKEGRFSGNINTGWRHESYRLGNGPTWVGQALAARLLGAEKLWNHDAFFDYVDRWVAEAKDGTFVQPKNAATAEPLEPDSLKEIETKAYNPFSSIFVEKMWEAYRPKSEAIGKQSAEKLLNSDSSKP